MRHHGPLLLIGCVLAAVLTFNKEGVTLHQNGRDVKAKRRETTTPVKKTDGGGK